MEIQGLRQLIQAGRYQVPPERVAEAIIQRIVDPLGIETERIWSFPEAPYRRRGAASTRYRLDHGHDSYARGDVVHAHEEGSRSNR